MAAAAVPRPEYPRGSRGGAATRPRTSPADGLAPAQVQNLQLSFAADGVGTKWTSGDIQRTPEFEEICGVSDRERVVGVVWYGYADGDPKQARRKLSVDDVLTRVP